MNDTPTSKTPETDASEFAPDDAYPNHVVDSGFARKLELQRNELLEALKPFAGGSVDVSGTAVIIHSEYAGEAVMKACSAIASVEGGQG